MRFIATCATCAVIVLAVGACAGANKQVPNTGNIDAASLALENAALRRQLAEKRRRQPASATHARQPLYGTIGNREEFCNGAMCLEVRNMKGFPIAELFVDGRRVALHSERGPFLWPGQSAYIRLRSAGIHIITATLTDAVTAGGRRFVTGAKIGSCRVRRQVPLSMDEQLGRAILYIGNGACRLGG